MNKLYIIGDLWETTAHKPKDYYVDGEELLEYLTQENILYSTANLVDEDSSLIVSSYIIENNNLMLSTGNSYD